MPISIENILILEGSKLYGATENVPFLDLKQMQIQINEISNFQLFCKLIVNSL